MARAIISFVLGAVILGLSIWWWTVVGPSFAFLGPIVLMGVGGALMVAGFAIFMDVVSPTSRKIQNPCAAFPLPCGRRDFSIL